MTIALADGVAPLATWPGSGSNPLGIKLELRLAGTWTDITQWLYQRNPVQITNRGRPDWTSTLQAGQVTLTLNNRDGRFSPKNTSGAFYPNITRNCPVRLSVNSQSVTGVSYSGYRFWGEVSEWPPQWDVSGNDVYVNIVAAGIWRRLSQLQTTLGSAYRRYYVNLTGTAVPQGYWPMEDGTGSTQVVSYVPLTAANGTWTGTPSLAAANDFPGSDAVIQLNAAVLTFTIPAGGTATNNVTRFIASVPAAGDSASGTTNWNLIEVNSAGTVAKFEVYYNFAGTLAVNLRNSGGTIIASGTTTTNVKGKPVLCSCELTPSGGNVAWAFRIITPGAASITESLTGTVTTASVGTVSTVRFDRAAVLMDTAVGHISVTYGSVPSLVTAAYALNGYLTETAFFRFSRLCIELGITAEIISTNANPMFAGSAGTGGWVGFNGTFAVTGSPPAGAPYPVAAQFTITTAAAGAALEQSGASIPASASAVYECGALVYTTTGTAVIGFDWQNSSHTYLSTNTVSITVPASTWTWVATTQTAPASTAFAYMRVAPADGSGNVIYVQMAVAGAVSALLGPQLDDTLANVLQAIEDTDCGLLFESVLALGLGYRVAGSITSQAAAVVLPYVSSGLGTLDPALTPVYDDAQVANNVTVTNYTGTAQQAILTAGPMSIQNPPNGIGNGYAATRNVSAAADTQLPGIASFLLALRSVDEIRFPVVTVQMIRASSAPFFASLPGLRIGDYFQITGMPSVSIPATVKQLVWGVSETLNARQWTLSFNSVPETPWESGFSPGTTQVAQVPGGSATFSQAPGTSLAPIIANGSITAAMLNQGITVHSLGGQAVTVASGAPPNPSTNDLWINSSTGLISQWSGSAWTPITLNASSVIQAGTIIGNLIAANTIAAANLVAGIVVAGIIDATTVQASQYIATAAQGEFLAYSGTPAAGNLVTAIAGAAGTDTHTNNFPMGLMSNQLTLLNQASAPAAFTNASSFYSSTAGRPRYLSQSGNDSCLERNTINVAQFTVGSTTTPTLISAPMTYQANEGNNSSEFEIEISGNGNWGSTLNSPIFQLMVDGSAPGGGTAGQFTVGVSGQTANAQLGYKIRYTLSVVNTGSGGSVTITADGVMWDQGANRIPGNSVALGTVSGSVPFDTTSVHTLQIYMWWAATTGSGQQLTTYRTQLGRRM